MKRCLSWLAAAVIGAAVGAVIVRSFYARAFRVAIPSELREMENEQRYRCVFSMAVLDRLERNEPDRAKLLLTREIVSYYKHPLGLAQSPERKKVLEHIDTLRINSVALKNAFDNEKE